MTKQTEALKLALEALESKYIVNCGAWRVQQDQAITAIREALALVNEVDQDESSGTEQPAQGCGYCNHPLYAGTKCLNCGRVTEKPVQPQQEPIYYMRDNHTFKKLSADVCTALVEIEHEFNEGYTHGALCSKRKGFRDVHASGSVNRLEFFADCKAALEQWLPTAPQAQRTWVGLTDEEIYEMADNGVFLGNIKEISRDIEAKLREKNSGDQK